MEPDPSRCPSCAAAVRPDAPWCTQCYAALAVPARETVPAIPAPRRAEAPPRHAKAPVPAPPATWPCTACATANPLALDRCATCDTPFLADLAREEPPLLVLPVVGDVARLSRTVRVALGLGVSTAAVAVTGVLGLLLR